MITRPLLLAFTLVVVSACSSASYTRGASEAEEERGDALAARMVDALGGMDAYDAVGFIAFDFTPEILSARIPLRRTEWDKRNGRVRCVETADDVEKVVIMDLADQRGSVKHDGKTVGGERRDQALEACYAQWVNDAYWLVAPFKVFDPGVTRASIDGDLRVSFEDGVGLTPGDAYLFELDDDGVPRSWSFRLESGAMASFDLSGRLDAYGITLFTRRISALGGGMTHENLVLAPSAPAALFTPSGG